jgi:hypothetical protein
LTIVFTGGSGRRYVYEGVPPEINDGLMAVKSKGAYFVKRIKAKFAFRQE